MKGMYEGKAQNTLINGNSLPEYLTEIVCPVYFLRSE